MKSTFKLILRYKNGGLRLERFSLTRGEVWRPMMINFILLFVLRWSGVSVIGSYAVTVLTSTKSSINEVYNNESLKKRQICFHLKTEKSHYDSE